MKGSNVSRLWANTRLIKRVYSSHTSIPPAAVSNFTFSGTETIGLLKASLSSGSIEKLSANIFISSYTRLSCPLSFAREKKRLGIPGRNSSYIHTLRFTKRYLIQQPVDHLLLFLIPADFLFHYFLCDSDRQIRYLRADFTNSFLFFLRGYAG